MKVQVTTGGLAGHSKGRRGPQFVHPCPKVLLRMRFILSVAHLQGKFYLRFHKKDVEEYKLFSRFASLCVFQSYVSYWHFLFRFVD